MSNSKIDNEEEEEVVGGVNLFVNPDKKTIKKELLVGAEDFFKMDKMYYNDDVKIVSKEEWLERIKELISFETDKSLSEIIAENSVLKNLSFEDIKYLYRFEIGKTAKEEEMVYFFSDNPIKKFPRCISKKMVGKQDNNKMFQ
ncbi:MAG: hypothetical protein ACOCP8_02075 [archaeon]